VWPLDQIVQLLNEQRLTERDKDCIRQLVAQEVKLNFGRLMVFFGAMVAGRKRFAQIAPYLATIVGEAPTWERVRWDGAPILLARSMHPKDLMRIGAWYTSLDVLAQRYRRIAQQGEVLRTTAEQAAEAGIITATLVAELEALLAKTARLVDGRRPFVHAAVEKAKQGTNEVDQEQPTLYQYDGEKWVPITAAEILEQYANVPMELRDS
jgi:hypothetical protein